MKRIAIIGCGGAGKSTLARQLGEILGIEVIHLDALNWKPGWVSTPQDEWHAIERDLVTGDSWIIDGNYGGTMAIRLARADSVIFLDFPTIICLYRAMRRVIRYYGRTRTDMGPGCPEKIDLSYVNWILGFRRQPRARIIGRLEEHCEGKRVIILRRPKEVEAFLREMRVSHCDTEAV